MSTCSCLWIQVMSAFSSMSGETGYEDVTPGTGSCVGPYGRQCLRVVGSTRTRIRTRSMHALDAGVVRIVLVCASYSSMFGETGYEDVLEYVCGDRA